jgi:hypothetical protein
MKRNNSYGARKIERPQPDELHLAIAKVVRSIETGTALAGGTCLIRSVIGSVVLDRYDIPHRIVAGGMLYRAGLLPHDCIAFAAEEDNLGHWPGVFHVWIEAGDDLVDFSCGDWEQQDKEIERRGNPRTIGLPPCSWTHKPPKYFWRKRDSFKWMPAPFGPQPGEAWYGGMATNQDLSHLWEEVAALRPEIEETVDKVFERLGLPVFKIFPDGDSMTEYCRTHGLLESKDKDAGDIFITCPKKES